MTGSVRSALTWVCLGSLLALALVGGLTTTVDRWGNLDDSRLYPKILYAAAGLIVVASYVSGAIDQWSTSALMASVIACLAGAAYWTAAIARHSGEFGIDGSVLIQIGYPVWFILASGAVFGVAGGLLGAGASAVYLGGRWLHNSVWSRRGVT